MFETKLHAIKACAISLECRCGHSALIAIAELTFDEETSVQDVISRARCSRCGAHRVQNVRLVNALQVNPYRPDMTI